MPCLFKVHNENLRLSTVPKYYRHSNYIRGQYSTYIPYHLYIYSLYYEKDTTLAVLSEHTKTETEMIRFRHMDHFCAYTGLYKRENFETS